MYNANAYSAASATSPLGATTISRRHPTEQDVQIEILFCGICHSDLHSVRNEWSELMPTVYPIVPGHEIVGRVTKVGSSVTKFKRGDLAAVGCLVDSDGTCPECHAGLEQFCPHLTLTFDSPDKHLGGVTYGGYSESIVVDQRFVLRVPSNLSFAGAAPLLCAGITTYSPMRRWNVSKGKKVGVVGLGGLGHMAVKFAHALGAHVVGDGAGTMMRVRLLPFGPSTIAVRWLLGLKSAPARLRGRVISCWCEGYRRRALIKAESAAGCCRRLG